MNFDNRILAIVLILTLSENCNAWYKTNFTVSPKLSAVSFCGINSRYFPESPFELWATWPWIGLMYYNGTGVHRCNAVLIHPQVAITSLECLRHIPDIKLEDHLFIAFSTPGQRSFQNISVIEMDTYHNGYNSQRHAALFKLSTPIVTSAAVHPICLWEESHDYNKQVSGHIGMGIGSDVINVYEINRLRVYQAPIRILSDEICRKRDIEFYNSTIAPNMCFVYLREPKECLGIGSALMLPRLAKNGDIVWYLRGLITQRGWYCENYPFMPAFDVGKHRQWIESHFIDPIEEPSPPINDPEITTQESKTTNINDKNAVGETSEPDQGFSKSNSRTSEPDIQVTQIGEDIDDRIYFLESVRSSSTSLSSLNKFHLFTLLLFQNLFYRY